MLLCEEYGNGLDFDLKIKTQKQIEQIKYNENLYEKKLMQKISKILRSGIKCVVAKKL